MTRRVTTHRAFLASSTVGAASALAACPLISFGDQSVREKFENLMSILHDVIDGSRRTVKSSQSWGGVTTVLGRYEICLYFAPGLSASVLTSR